MCVYIFEYLCMIVLVADFEALSMRCMVSAPGGSVRLRGIL